MKFLRTSTNYYKRLKRKQKWRKPKGIDNKIGQKIRGKQARVSIGYGTNRKERGKINGKQIVLVRNLREANKLEKGNFVVIGKLGKKKRKEVEKILNERGLLK